VSRDKLKTSVLLKSHGQPHATAWGHMGIYCSDEGGKRKRIGAENIQELVTAYCASAKNTLSPGGT